MFCMGMLPLYQSTVVLRLRNFVTKIPWQYTGDFLKDMSIDLFYVWIWNFGIAHYRSPEMFRIRSVSTVTNIVQNLKTIDSYLDENRLTKKEQKEKETLLG